MYERISETAYISLAQLVTSSRDKKTTGQQVLDVEGANVTIFAAA